MFPLEEVHNMMFRIRLKYVEELMVHGTSCCYTRILTQRSKLLKFYKYSIGDV